MANLLFLSVWRKKVWRMNRSAIGLSMVGINLDGFSLANRLQFAKFTKLFPRQTFPLYGMCIMKLLACKQTLLILVNYRLDAFTASLIIE